MKTERVGRYLSVSSIIPIIYASMKQSRKSEVKLKLQRNRRKCATGAGNLSSMSLQVLSSGNLTTV